MPMIGTILELFYTWQLVQVQHLCETPIILFGPMWGPLLAWLQEEVQARGMFAPKDMCQLFLLDTPDKVVRAVRVNHDRYHSEMT